DDTHRFVGLRGGERGAHLGHHRPRECVATFGSIDGDGRDAVVDVVQQRVVAHWVPVLGVRDGYRRTVVITGLAVLIGLVIGLVLPHRHHRVARPRPRALVVLGAGVAAQVAAAEVSGRPGLALLLGAYALLVLFALANVHIPGAVVLAIGLLI